MTRRLQAELVSQAGSRLGEGPIWDVEKEELIWVDILGNEVRRTNPTTGITATTPAPAAPGAVSFDAQGRVLASLPDGLYETTSWAMIAPIEQENLKTRCNDGRVDPWGRLVQGTMGWSGEPGVGSLHRVSADGEVETLMTGLTIPNGMAWTTDTDTLYHVDTATHTIRRYSYSELGELGVGETAVEVDKTRGAPDGMTIDVEGCLWVALWGGGAVHRYTPDGRLDAVVELPITHVSSCCFGGKTMDTLFITTAGAFVEPEKEPHAGRLFACEPNVTGFPEYRFGVSSWG